MHTHTHTLHENYGNDKSNDDKERPIPKRGRRDPARSGLEVTG